MNYLKKIYHVGELVKFSHTIFALPFALASLLVASGGRPPARLLLLVIAAMVTARTAAMAFNRWIDADFDARNPRTATRHIPAGLLSKRFVLLVSLGSAILFVLVTYWINPLVFRLSPIALLILFGYSYTKRFTALSHLVLGLALGIAPIGAWMAARGSFELAPILLGIAVLFWVAGFDMIYATQDAEFDRQTGLHSLVVALGIPRALYGARLLHLLTLTLLICFGSYNHLTLAYYVCLVGVGILLAYEHSLVSPQNLSRVNAAFFTINGFISLLYLSGVAYSLLIS